MALAGRPAAAQADEPLYQAVAIVTGTDMRSRPAGFRRCLEEVLVKLSGDPALPGVSRFAAVTAHPELAVAGFGYVDPLARQRPHDDQGSYDRSYELTVRFERGAVDGMLAALGARPWEGVRPVVVPALEVRGFGVPFTRQFRLTADEPLASVMRQSLERAAAMYGMAVQVPAAAGFGAAETAGTVLVTGSLEFRPEALGWVAAFAAEWAGARYRWGVSGVGFDVAFDRLVGGVMRFASGHGGPE